MNEDKRELIRRAAIKVISQEGFHQVTTDRIADEAGVAVGTIYNYFRNKEDIRSYIFEVERQRRAAFFRQVQGESAHPLEKVRRLLAMHFQAVQADPAIARVILEERRLAHSRPGGPECEGLPDFLAELLREGIAGGAIRPCDPSLVATAIFGAVEALMARYVQELAAYGQSETLGRASDEIYRLLHSGLST